MFRQSVKITKLANGITVMTDLMPHAESATIGAWIPRGSRHESPEEMGLSHFYEHLVFKGTENRTASEIARAVEDRGGALEAYTTRQETGFYAHVVREDVSFALEVIADLLMNPKMDALEVEKERKVILEEIRSYEDIPEEVAGDAFNALHFQGSGLAHPITGTLKSVKELTYEQVLKAKREVLTDLPLLVCAAGKVEHEKLVEECDRLFAKKRTGGKTLPVHYRSFSGTKVIKRDIQQSNLMLGTSFLKNEKYPDLRYALLLFHVALGSGMASRLFQKIREEQGLVYSIYASTDVYSDSFGLEMAFAAEKKRAEKALTLVWSELEKFLQNGFAAGELARTKQNILGGMRIGFDSTEKRVLRLAEQMLRYGYCTPVHEVKSRILSLNETDVMEMMRETVGKSAWALAAVVAELPAKPGFPLWNESNH
ncbi:MAG: insulinase family protein [Fibrobacter sp.]|jgi:predicted Zn-dependent peptidase|nr:insulinase family protein [Fibrobacter sp.]